MRMLRVVRSSSRWATRREALTLELFFEDSTQTALSSAALPLAPPAIAGFGFRQFRLFSDDAQFLGTVDTLICSAGVRWCWRRSCAGARDGMDFGDAADGVRNGRNAKKVSTPQEF